MKVERLWPDSRLRNYHYLIVCEESGEALAVDPLDSALLLKAAREHGWDITQILNTHHHSDHTAGNDALRAATGARIFAHAAAAPLIGGIDVGLGAGDVIRVGRSVERCLMPGRTMSRLPVRACGRAGTVLWRHIVQRRCWQLPPGGDPKAVRDLCHPAAQLPETPPYIATTTC
jgi:hydroxyacylglutathione hydrolase